MFGFGFATLNRKPTSVGIWKSGLSLSFNSPVALIFTYVAHLLFYGCIVSQGSYTFSGQKFKDFPGPYLEISRTFFNDNFTSKPRKMFLSISMFLWSSHCLEDFLRILRASCLSYGSARPTFPLQCTCRSILLLQAKQDALFEL